MPKGKNGESCNEAVRAVISTDEVVSFAELFGRVRERGNWTDSTIYQHLMSLVVNLPPARHHWKNSKPFLFLHADGRYELYKVTGYESLREKVLETLEARANGLCDECIKMDKEMKEVVREGGVYWKCSKCNSSGALRATSDLSMLTRETSGIKAPESVGFDFEGKRCPVCDPQEEPDGG